MWWNTDISSLVTTLPKMSSHVNLSLKKCGWSASMSFVVIYQLSWHLSTKDLLVSCTLMDNVLYTVLCIRFNIFLIINPTTWTNFSNLFLEWNSTCFGQFLCPSSGVFHCTHSNGICHTGLLTPCEQDNGKLLMMDRGTVRNMQSFIPRINCEKSVHLVGFIIRNLSRCTDTWVSNLISVKTMQETHVCL
jgi:hypothetical protein